MNKYKCILLSTDDIMKFVEKMNKYEFDIDVCVGHYLIDAKSILGIMGIGTGKEIEIIAHTEESKTLAMDLAEYMLRIA